MAPKTEREQGDRTTAGKKWNGTTPPLNQYVNEENAWDDTADYDSGSPIAKTRMKADQEKSKNKQNKIKAKRREMHPEIKSSKDYEKKKKKEKTFKERGVPFGTPSGRDNNKTGGAIYPEMGNGLAKTLNQ